MKIEYRAIIKVKNNEDIEIKSYNLKSLLNEIDNAKCQLTGDYEIEDIRISHRNVSPWYTDID